LQAKKVDQAQERERAGERWEDHDLIFATHDGKLLSPRNVARAFRQDCERAGLPNTIHPHCLRHTMASHWLAGGQSIKVVSERLGHTSVAFTLQTYAHLLPNQQVEAADHMDAQLFGPTIPTTSPRALTLPVTDETGADR
jgi:site-specific recombinase XerD